MRITFISDTHGKHELLTNQLPGGNVLVHAGDISEMGREHEVRKFLKWFDSISWYDYKIFIAGNHDWLFQHQDRRMIDVILKNYGDNITYLQDEYVDIWGIKFYGSPWTPYFNNWAFNLTRNGDQLRDVWQKIPENTDVLITHGPPYQILDYTDNSPHPVGCERLQSRVLQVKPIIHTFGHIHESYGEKKFQDVTFLNATNMDGSYIINNPPITLNLDLNTKQITYEH